MQKVYLLIQVITYLGQNPEDVYEIVLPTNGIKSRRVDIGVEEEGKLDSE
jgi:hypothetical protein